MLISMVNGGLGLFHPSDSPMVFPSFVLLRPQQSLLKMTHGTIDSVYAFDKFPSCPSAADSGPVVFGLLVPTVV